MVDTNTHLFAINVNSFWTDTRAVGDTVIINQEDLLHRLVKVLRSSVQDKFIFFDQHYHGLVEIKHISKRDISVQVLTVNKNLKNRSKIILLLPLLKKEALEEAVYAATELGADQIRLVVTKKSRQNLLHLKEYERLQNIVIAAAEQSKNFSYPILYKPCLLFDLVDKDVDLQNSRSVVFDGQGESFFSVHSQLSDTSVSLLVGPEAGFEQEEMLRLKERNVVFCCLTNTTLRAIQAVALGVGAFRLQK